MKNFKTDSDSDLITQIRIDAAQERRSGLAVIQQLREVARRRVASMEALTDLPELEAKIEGGELTLANLSQVQSFCKQNDKTVEEKKAILKQVDGLSKRATEKKLAEIAPQPERSERKRELDGQKTELLVTLDAETVAALDKIRDLIAHLMPDASYAQVIAHLAKLGLKRLDPSAERAPRKIHCPPGDRIPVAHRRTVWKRDGGKSGYVSPETGRCCGSMKRVQVDHVIPRAMGGTHEIGNLRRRCRSHNLWAAIQVFGKDRMGQYIRL